MHLKEEDVLNIVAEQATAKNLVGKLVHFTVYKRLSLHTVYAIKAYYVAENVFELQGLTTPESDIVSYNKLVNNVKFISQELLANLVENKSKYSEICVNIADYKASCETVVFEATPNPKDYVVFEVVKNAPSVTGIYSGHLFKVIRSDSRSITFNYYLKGDKANNPEYFYTYSWDYLKANNVSHTFFTKEDMNIN